jgi:hypothetical protein
MNVTHNSKPFKGKMIMMCMHSSFAIPALASWLQYHFQICQHGLEKGIAVKNDKVQ